jgi:N-methylhydantoinase B
VREDVYQGYVTPDAARDSYGVVLDPQTLAVDRAATEALRAERRERTAAAAE